jgi:large repetitive protein
MDRTVLPLNGQTTIRAVVTESAGTPVHNGTMVTFQPAIGTTSPVEAPTVNGVATATFLAGTMSGRGFVHAFSGAARTGSGNSSSGGVEVFIGAAAAGSISVSASPSSVSQSGGTVTVSALVLDSSNNPLPGVSVLFTTANGTLNATTALSDSSGIARTQLTTTQTTTVQAIAGAAKGEVRVEASAAPTVTVAADNGTVGQPVPITVTFSGGGGGGNTSPRQIQSLVVDFGDGSSETRFNVTGSSAFTHTYGRAGGYTITATATDVAGNTGTASDAITVGHAPQPSITAFSANPNPVPPANNGLTNITVTATPSSASVPIRSVVVRRSDGTVIFSGTSGGTFAYQFPAASGSQTITASVTDANGETATSTTVVVVQ